MNHDCPVCHKNKATIHPIYGVMACTSCKNKRSRNTLPSRQAEMVGESIKNERREYAKSIIQPWRSGVLSKEYLELYGTKNIKPTKKDLKNAKRVWSEIHSSNTDLKKTK